MRSRTVWRALLAMVMIAVASFVVYTAVVRHTPPPPAARPTSSPSATPSIFATYDGVEIACRRPDIPPWTGAKLCLPQGHRAAAYDAQRDIIWITTRALGPLGDEKHDLDEIQLTEFHPETGASATRTIEKLDSRKRTGLIAPVAVNEDGYVWLAWRQMLGRFDPSAGSLKKWSLPAASLDPNPNASGIDGYPTSVTARGNDVWVTVAESRRLWHFDNRTGRWDSLSLGRLYTSRGSDAQVLPDGRIAVNGVIRMAKNDFVGRLTIVDPRRRTAHLQKPALDRFVVRPNGSIVALDDKNVLGVLNPKTGRLVPSTIAVGPFNPNESLVSDHLGRIWLTSTIDRRFVIVRADVDGGTRSEFTYPVEMGTINRGPPGFAGGPRLVTFDPSLTALVPDIRGDVWVLSQHGGGAIYPSVYRLRPA